MGVLLPDDILLLEAIKNNILAEVNLAKSEIIAELRPILEDNFGSISDELSSIKELLIQFSNNDFSSDNSFSESSKVDLILSLLENNCLFKREFIATESGVLNISYNSDIFYQYYPTGVLSVPYSGVAPCRLSVVPDTRIDEYVVGETTYQRDNRDYNIFIFDGDGNIIFNKTVNTDQKPVSGAYISNKSVVLNTEDYCNIADIFENITVSAECDVSSNNSLLYPVQEDLIVNLYLFGCESGQLIVDFY